MLLVACPWCGPRDEVEFRFGGQAELTLPAEPETLDDAAWAELLYMRDNVKGPQAERWFHGAGCRRWFNAIRDTVDNRILATYRLDEPRPAAP